MQTNVDRIFLPTVTHLDLGDILALNNKKECENSPHQEYGHADKNQQDHWFTLGLRAEVM